MAINFIKSVVNSGGSITTGGVAPGSLLIVYQDVAGATTPTGFTNLGVGDSSRQIAYKIANGSENTIAAGGSPGLGVLLVYANTCYVATAAYKTQASAVTTTVTTSTLTSIDSTINSLIIGVFDSTPNSAPIPTFATPTGSWAMWVGNTA